MTNTTELVEGQLLKTKWSLSPRVTFDTILRFYLPVGSTVVYIGERLDNEGITNQKFFSIEKNRNFYLFNDSLGVFSYFEKF